MYVPQLAGEGERARERALLGAQLRTRCSTRHSILAHAQMSNRDDAMLGVSPSTPPSSLLHASPGDIPGPLPPPANQLRAATPDGDDEVVVWTMGLFHHDDAQMHRCVNAQIVEAETEQEARSTFAPGVLAGLLSVARALSPTEREQKKEMYSPPDPP